MLLGMFSMEIILLGFALSIDAALVTFALGLMHEHEPKWQKFKNGLIVASAFGLFQAFMLWFGSYGGYLFTYSQYGNFFQLLIGFIFLGLGLKCFQESFVKENKKVQWGLLPVIILGILTSIDALAAGVTLGTIPRSYLVAIEIGFITFGCCSLFYFLSQFLGRIPDKWLLRFAGMIFLSLGGQVFWNIRQFI